MGSSPPCLIKGVVRRVVDGSIYQKKGTSAGVVPALSLYFDGRSAVSRALGPRGLASGSERGLPWSLLRGEPIARTVARDVHCERVLIMGSPRYPLARNGDNNTYWEKRYAA